MALLPGYRPAGCRSTSQRSPQSFRWRRWARVTRYTAHVLHADAANRGRQAEMGFADGWGMALEQLVAYAKTM
jgi:hypothetical protein